MSNRVADRILVRVYLLLVLFVLFGVGVVVQVAYLQWEPQARWRDQAMRHKVYPKRQVAQRGSILASQGEVLATTLPFYRVALDMMVLQRQRIVGFPDSLQLLSTLLSRHLGRGQLTPDYFLEKLNRARRLKDQHVYLFPVGRTLNYLELKLLRTFPLLNRGRFKGGLIVEQVDHKRFYPYGDLARITLGLMIDDTLPTKGLEISYHKYLRGQDGLAVVQRLPGGIEMPIEELSSLEPHDGYDLVTTLNVTLQDVAYEALKEGVVKNDAQGGVAIIMEAATGDVKAVANYPETYNHALATDEEPGSTFKLATSMALLEAGVVTPDEVINTGKGSVTFYDRTMKDGVGHGKITFQEAFEVSSNVAFGKLVQKNFRQAPDKFLQQLERTGITRPTGIAMKGEPTPYLIRPDDKLWNGTTLPWLATGYNVRLTPLQVLTFYNAVANGGRMLQPRLVQEVRLGREVVKQFASQVLQEQVCSPATLANLRTMLEGVVQRGTARNIYDPRYRIAGKTGTARKLVGQEYKRVYRSSFCGYFPADKPLYTVLVLIDEPSRGEFYGAQVAAPVFKRIADFLYGYDWRMNPRSLPGLEQGPAQPWQQVMSRTSLIAYLKEARLPTDNLPKGPFIEIWQHRRRFRLTPVELKPGVVPRLQGMAHTDALQLLAYLGIEARTHGHGHVARQSLKPGTPLRPRQRLDLYLS